MNAARVFNGVKLFDPPEQAWYGKPGEKFDVVLRADYDDLSAKASAEIAKWQNSAVEDQARIAQLEAALSPLAEIDAVLGKGWIQSLADSLAGRPNTWRFRAKAGELCTRCGEAWGPCNNYPGQVYHLCKVPGSADDGGVEHE